MANIIQKNKFSKEYEACGWGIQISDFIHWHVLEDWLQTLEEYMDHMCFLDSSTNNIL